MALRVATGHPGDLRGRSRRRRPTWLGVAPSRALYTADRARLEAAALVGMPAAPERKYGTNATVPCHHALSKMLHAGIADSRKGGLFRTSPDDNADVMTEQPMNQKDGWRSALALEMTELPKSWSPRGSPRSNKTREGPLSRPIP